MKYSDELYRLAFQTRDLAPWEFNADNVVFSFYSIAAKKNVYCDMMGLMGQHLALAAYIGERGLQSLYSFQDKDVNTDYSTDPDSPSSNVVYMQRGQNCVQVTFDSDDFVFEDQRDAVFAYARKHHHELTGNQDIPNFVDFRPRMVPETLTDPVRMAVIEEAMNVLPVYLEKYGEDGEKGRLIVFGTTTSIPFYVFKDGKWAYSGLVPVTGKRAKFEPVPFYDPDLVKEMAGYVRTGELMCEMTLMPMETWTEEDGGGELCYPECLLSYETEQQYFFPPSQQIHSYEEKNADVWPRILDGFIKNVLVEHEFIPKRILWRGRRTYALLADLCMKLDIELVEEHIMEPLDSFLGGLIRDLAESDGTFVPKIEEMAQQILKALRIMSKEEILNLPDQAVQMLMLFPEEALKEETYEEISKYQAYFED